jgi:fructose-1,6-bisphosphatase/inositol monophosphatase family enzyme
MRPDPLAVGAIIARIAAAEIAPRFGRLEAHEISEKTSPSDLVTEVDRAAERALSAALLDLTPGAAFVGEESAAADPSIAAAIPTADRCWIVDPLDGTRNFVRGSREYGVIVAYLEKGRAMMSWIHAPEEKASLVASRGDGVTWNGAPVRPRLAAADPPSGFRSVGWLTPAWRDRIGEAMKTRVATKAAHCSAYAYIRLARGEVDFALSSRIHPWDHVAGALALEELGGGTFWLEDEEAYLPGESVDAPLLSVAPGRDAADIARRFRGEAA